MNLAESKFYLDLVQWLVTLALAVTVWLRKPGKDAGQAVLAMRKELDEVIADHRQRLIKIETHLSHMATSEALGALGGTVQKLIERASGLNEQMRVMRTTLDRIEQFLLNHK